MRRHDKEIQLSFFDNEEAVIKELKKVYKRASDDCAKKISDLSARTDMENLQTIIYQKQYQQALKAQIDSILDMMQAEEFTLIADYLTKCYEDGFVSVMYSLQQQGIPLTFPINQDAVVRAVETDSKLSTKLYNRLGEDVDELKKSIRSELSRGIANGSSYNEMAKQIAMGMNSPFKKAINSAIRITRTEGHRIQIESAMDSCYAAKDAGADIVKQWDSTLDKRTRPSHQKVDGEIRELDEKFSNGLEYPGDPKGRASEVVNCRCALLQRAKWALTESELDTLKERAKFFGIDKAENFEDFKKKYVEKTVQIQREEVKPKFAPAKTIEEAEEYVKQFVKEKTWSKDGNVSYKGLSVEHANIINETLTELYSKFDLPKLTNIQPMNFKQSLWKGSEQAPAAYNSNISGGLFLNPKLMKNKSAFSKYFEEGKKAYEYCKENINKFTGKDRILIEKYVSAGRSLVSEDAENKMKATIQHEIGHHIQNTILYKDEAASKIIKDGFEEYSIKISGYATKTYGEYIAESFCAYMNDEAERIDPELVKVFEGMVR